MTKQIIVCNKPQEPLDWLLALKGAMLLGSLWRTACIKGARQNIGSQGIYRVAGSFVRFGGPHSVSKLSK